MHVHEYHFQYNSEWVLMAMIIITMIIIKIMIRQQEWLIHNEIGIDNNNKNNDDATYENDRKNNINICGRRNTNHDNDYHYSSRNGANVYEVINYINIYE